MGTQPETRLQRRIQQAIKKKYKKKAWIFKVHGGSMQAAGVPDLVMCIHGLFFALEVKRPIASSKASPIQLATIDIINEAEGYAGITRSPEEALKQIDEVLCQWEF